MQLNDFITITNAWVGDFLLPFYFIVSFLVVLVLIFNTLVLPKKLRKVYLVTPWFSKGECIAYKSGLGSLVFAWLVTLAVCFPELRGRHRNMQDIRNNAPSWFKNSSFLLMFLFLIMIFSFIAMMLYVGLSSLVLDN